MKTYPLTNAPEVFRKDNSTGHLLAETQQADIVLLYLAPGDCIPSHALELPVLFSIAEGSATLMVGGETERLSAGDVAEVAPGETREWTNLSDSPCRIFVTKLKV